MWDISDCSHWKRGVIQLSRDGCSFSFLNFNHVVFFFKRDLIYVYIFAWTCKCFAVFLTMQGGLKFPEAILTQGGLYWNNKTCMWVLLTVCVGRLSHLLQKNWCEGRLKSSSTKQLSFWALSYCTHHLSLICCFFFF